MNLAMCEVPVHPVEFLTEADVALIPELPMTQDADGTYYCDGESTQETQEEIKDDDGSIVQYAMPSPDNPSPIINTYQAGVYRAICGDKVYKVVLDDDLRSVPGVVDRVRIDTGRGVCWVERKVVTHIFNENDYFYLHNAGKDTFSFGFREKKWISGKASICNYFKNKSGDTEDCSYWFAQPSYIPTILFKYRELETLENWNNWVKEKYDSGNPMIFLAALATPTTHQSVPTLLTTIEPTKSLTIENTVNAPAEVRVKGDSWQGSTTGAQLFDAENAKYIIGISFNGFGGFIKGQNVSRIYYIDALPNTTFHFQKELGAFNRVVTCENIPSIGGKVTNKNDDTGNNECVITTGENDKYIAFYPLLVSEVNTIGYDNVIQGIMINAGSTPLPWEPYTGNAPSPSPEYPQDIISVSGILKSTNNSLGGRDKLRESQITIPELRAIPGTDVRDELVVYEDGTGKIVRRVKNVIYDNEKSIASLDSVGKLFKLGGAILSNYNQLHGMCCCDKFISKGLQAARSSDYAITSYGTSLYIRNKDLTTVEEAKAWIVNNPITVFAPLATHTEELLTADQVQGILRTHQYHTEIGFEGLDEHLEPEIEVVCKVLGR